MTVTVENEGESWTALRLRALRKKAKLTQEQLADAAGLDRTTIVHLERPKNPRTMTPYYADRLAGPLNVEAAELLPPTGDEDDQRDPLVRLRSLEDAMNALVKEVRRLTREVAGSRQARPKTGREGRP